MGKLAALETSARVSNRYDVGNEAAVLFHLHFVEDHCSLTLSEKRCITPLCGPHLDRLLGVEKEPQFEDAWISSGFHIVGEEEPCLDETWLTAPSWSHRHRSNRIACRDSLFVELKLPL